MMDAEWDDKPIFEWASETLMGICVWVQEHKHITDKQKQAIRNIANSRDRWEGEMPD
jgi:hypothetical protein